MADQLVNNYAIDSDAGGLLIFKPKTIMTRDKIIKKYKEIFENLYLMLDNFKYTHINSNKFAKDNHIQPCFIKCCVDFGLIETVTKGLKKYYRIRIPLKKIEPITVYNFVKHLNMHKVINTPIITVKSSKSYPQTCNSNYETPVYTYIHSDLLNTFSTIS